MDCNRRGQWWLKVGVAVNCEFEVCISKSKRGARKLVCECECESKLGKRYKRETRGTGKQSTYLMRLSRNGYGFVDACVPLFV